MRKLLFFLLGANAVSLLWGAVSHRGLFADGVYFYFHLLDSRYFFWDVSYQRLFSTLLQIPALVFLKLHPSEQTATPALLFSLALHLHPFLSLWISYKILVKFGKKELFVFPALSFALCTQSLMGYPTIIIPETLSLFWPLFLLLTFRQGKTAWETPLATALLLGLAFAYEAAIVFFLLLLLVLVARRKNHQTANTDFFLTVISLAGFLFMASRPFGPAAGNKQVFLDTLLGASYREPFRLVGFGMAGSLTVALSACAFRPRLDQAASRFLYASTLLITLCFAKKAGQSQIFAELAGEIWTNRTTVIPLAFLLAALLLFTEIYKSQLALEKGKTFSAVLTLTCAALLISFIQDIGLTKNWIAGYRLIQNLRKENPGCNVIDPLAEKNLLGTPHRMGGWWVPLLTLAPEVSLKPVSIFLNEFPPEGEACLAVPSKSIAGKKLNAFLLTDPVQSFDLRNLKGAPIRIHTWDGEKNTLVSRIVENAAKKDKTPLSLQE